MIAHLRSGLSLGFFTCGVFTASLSADTLSIGNFEGGSLDGWAVSGFSGNAGRSVAVDTVGATSGTGSLRYTAPIPGGYAWGIQQDLNPFMATIGGASNVLLSFDITWDQSQWATTNGNWAQIAEVAFNSAATGFKSLARPTITSDSASGFFGGWDSTNYPGIHTRTITWDLTSIFAGSAQTNPYAQLGFAFNFSGDFTSGGIFYLDNIRITVPSAAIPEPSSYAQVLGVFALSACLLRRRVVR